MRSNERTPSRAAASHPLLHILVSFPIAFFCGALMTDLAYLDTANMLWADFSSWLLAVGTAFAALAALAGLIDLVVHRRARAWRRVWPLGAACLLVLLVALADNFIHSRDAWTSVVPTGLAVTAILAVLTLATAWLGFAVPLTSAASPLAVAPGSSRAEVRA